MAKKTSDDLDHYRSVCTRFLGGHGAPSAGEQLAAIPGDAALDRYGAGGVVAALAGLELRLPRMPEYHAHAVAIAKALRGVPGVEILPDPPHTNMMRLLLTVGEARLRRNACRIAREQGVYTLRWNGPGLTPSTRMVELTVGDATLDFEPREVAELVAGLVR